MAYLPPHKRHQKGSAVAPPSPALQPVSSGNPKYNPGEIIYAENSKRKWFIVGLPLADESRVLNLTRLEPVSMELYQRNSSLALVLEENGEDQKNTYHSENPWTFEAGKVKHDLISSFEKLKEDIKSCCEFGELKPLLVARLGKVLFRGNSTFPFHSITGSSVPGKTLRRLPQSFHTSVPPSFMEYLTNEVVPINNFTFEEDKQVYFLKSLQISDKARHNLVIICKCRLIKDTNQLQLYKIELNHVRYLVADLSCLDKNLDFRLMLSAKRSFVDLTDEELRNINGLVNSAIIDSEAKGGLRWPSEKHTSWDQYTVVQDWHTRFQTYINSSMRLKVRHGDRFDFRTSHRDVDKVIMFPCMLRS